MSQRINRLSLRMGTNVEGQRSSKLAWRHTGVYQLVKLYAALNRSPVHFAPSWVARIGFISMHDGKSRSRWPQSSH